MSVTDVLGLNDLMAQLILAVGAAMVLGNALAILQHARGKHPKAVTGEFRAGRASWLLAVGLLITLWGIASLVTS
jgi:hypothetical protein